MTETVNIPAGIVTVTTYGTLQFETVQSLLDMRSYSEKNGLTNIAWTFVPGSLVDRARNEAARQFIRDKSRGWLLFVDGDAVFPQDALEHLLRYAYHADPACDIVGSYNPLRGAPYLPTIDTGTGTWESHYPFEGPKEVIRTGSAFILAKRHVYEQMEPPWYGIRHPARAIDAFAELDNFARQKFDGENPLAKHPAWTVLLRCAKDDPGTQCRPEPSMFVGEDSNFCDRAKFLGFKIVVLTDVACGHVDRKVITAEDHKTEMRRSDRLRRLAVGGTR